MPTVFFAQADGRIVTVDAEPDTSLMYSAVTNGIDGIEAECGGGLVCGTCHVYIDTAWIDRVGPASQVEDTILDGVDGVRSSSRLAC